MKSGTTSLHYYLDLHPEISMSKKKEVNFFYPIFQPPLVPGQHPHVEFGNWNKGVKWYESHFSGTAKIHGESSTNYTKYPIFAGVAERMHSVLPDAKLIYILRDPIERIIAQYIHAYAGRFECGTFSEALTNNDHYVDCSRYYMQLEQYLPYYQESHILLLTAERLRSHRQETLRQVFRFLGVDDGFQCDEYSRLLHSSVNKRRKNDIGLVLAKLGVEDKIKQSRASFLSGIYDSITSTRVGPPRLGARLRQELVHALRDDVTQLRNYTGERFEDWSL